MLNINDYLGIISENPKERVEAKRRLRRTIAEQTGLDSQKINNLVMTNTSLSDGKYPIKTIEELGNALFTFNCLIDKYKKSI